jgi:hypothetical protein
VDPVEARILRWAASPDTGAEATGGDRATNGGRPRLIQMREDGIWFDRLEAWIERRL